jgi:hypothetical protein
MHVASLEARNATARRVPAVARRTGERDREEIVYAGADLADAGRRRSWNEYNQLLRDRRGDVYAEMLGADAWPGWYRTTGPGAVAPG